MKKFLFLLLCLTSQIQAYPFDVCICAIFKDEAPYLKEWIDYHHDIGVDHFFLYNNQSSDNYQHVLKPYIESDIVTLIEWPSPLAEDEWRHFTFSVQCGAYQDALKKCKHMTEWLAIIDVDEFIVPISCKNIKILLNTEYKYYSGVCVNWQCYGTSHVAKCDEGKMLKQLTYKMKWDHEWNKHSKSIVRPSHVDRCPNPHFCLYKKGYWAVDADGNKCIDCPSSVLIGKIRINHYWTRDEWFLYNVKIPRYLKWGNNMPAVLKQAEEMNFEYDPILANQL